MKYVSIDIETTGLDPETCDIIEFAAIIDDTERPDVPVEELPAFRSLVRHEVYQGEPYALAMHSEIFRKLAEDEDAVLPDEECRVTWENNLGDDFSRWLTKEGIAGKIVAAGKNFGAFDLRFLRRLTAFTDCIEFHHRSLDPAMLFLRPDDPTPPSLAECLRRAGLADSVSHRALQDARDVVRLIRAGLGQRGSAQRMKDATNC